jgi:hypothetical protein
MYKLYPIYFNGKQFNQKDCDSLFQAFYNKKADLAPNGTPSVYVGERLWIFPDGTIDDENSMP